MTKMIDLSPQLEKKLRLASAQSGKSEEELLRDGLERACDEILSTQKAPEENLAALIKSLLADSENEAKAPSLQEFGADYGDDRARHSEEIVAAALEKKRAKIMGETKPSNRSVNRGGTDVPDPH
jgi:hypothetical protein